MKHSLFALLICSAALLSVSCGSDEANKEEASVDTLRQNLRAGEFINSRKFRRVADDYAAQLYGIGMGELMDCQVYYYTLSERSASIGGTTDLGSFKNLGWDNAKRYKYELGYKSFELALVKIYRDILQLNKGSMSSAEYSAFRQREYSPLIYRECYWEFDPDAPYISIVHEWYCKGDHYARKAQYEFEDYIGNVPEFCDGLADSYLEDGVLSRSEKRFVLDRPNLDE